MGQSRPPEGLDSILTILDRYTRPPLRQLLTRYARRSQAGRPAGSGRTATNTAKARPVNGHRVLRDEAEYQTLIAALKDLASRTRRAGKAPSEYSLLIHTDS